jgi:serine/threonine-protein kinase
VASLVGQTIDGRYRVDSVLARGGMGAVLRGTHLVLGQPVAIKVMLDATMKDASMRDRFLREARILAQVRAPTIASIFDAGLLPDGTLYLVMELLEGEDLEKVLSRGVLSPERAAKVVAQICEGLAEAHAQGIVHRDLKPANVFIVKRPSGETLVKLIDFGISKKVGDSSETTGVGTLVGSPYYMAPEQIYASRDVDHRADLWSLGIILFRLVTGKQPFDGPSLATILTRIKSGAPVFPDDLDSSFAAVVRRCLEKDKTKRYTDANELRAALLALRLEPTTPPSLDDPTEALVRDAPAKAVPSAAREDASAKGPSPAERSLVHGRTSQVNVPGEVKIDHLAPLHETFEDDGATARQPMPLEEKDLATERTYARVRPPPQAAIEARPRYSDEPDMVTERMKPPSGARKPRVPSIEPAQAHEIGETTLENPPPPSSARPRPPPSNPSASAAPASVPAPLPASAPGAAPASVKSSPLPKLPPPRPLPPPHVPAIVASPAAPVVEPPPSSGGAPPSSLEASGVGKRTVPMRLPTPASPMLVEQAAALRFDGKATRPAILVARQPSLSDSSSSSWQPMWEGGRPKAEAPEAPRPSPSASLSMASALGSRTTLAAWTVGSAVVALSFVVLIAKSCESPAEPPTTATSSAPSVVAPVKAPPAMVVLSPEPPVSSPSASSSAAPTKKSVKP